MVILSSIRPNTPLVDMIHTPVQLLNSVTPGNVSELAVDMSDTQKVQSEAGSRVQS